MVATWRLIVGAMAALLAYFLSKPLMTAVLSVIRRKVGKRFRWIADIQRFMLTYLSWMCFMILLILIAVYILDLKQDGTIVGALQYLLAVPLILGTFALRKVMTNIIVRHFKWDKQSEVYDTRIFVVTETFKFLCFIVIVAEIFYIFFASSELASFLMVELFLILEIIVVLGGFTLLKNVATGLFLIFAEPFRTGSYCHVADLVGFIERVSLARTIMRRRDGALVFIPNGAFADHHQSNEITDGGEVEVVRWLQVDPTTSMNQMHKLVHALTDSVEQFTLREDSDQDPKTVDVSLQSMFQLKVALSVDRQQFTSLEHLHTEVNFTIMDVLQRLQINARQLKPQNS